MKKLLFLCLVLLAGCTYKPQDTWIKDVDGTVLRDAIILQESVDSGDVFIVERKREHYVFKSYANNQPELVYGYKLWDAGDSAYLTGVICFIVAFLIGLLIDPN